MLSTSDGILTDRFRRPPAVSSAGTALAVGASAESCQRGGRAGDSVG